MPAMNLLIPLLTTDRDGFYNCGAPAKQLFGYNLHMRVQETYFYLELQGVPSELSVVILEKVRSVLPWAALRLNFGILAGGEGLQVVNSAFFDGQFPTAYNPEITPCPMRVVSNHQSQEADTLLFSALIEGSNIQALVGPNPREEFRLACELFAAADFEASANAQFLALISILEIIARPAPRPMQCLNIIQDAMTRMKQEAEAAHDPALIEALTDMHDSALHWKRESIRSSIRRLGTKTSQALGDLDPQARGRTAVRLYDKRSKVVHKGTTASLADVAETRQIVREALAVEAGYYAHIRERFPAN